MLKRVSDLILEEAYKDGFDFYKVPGISQNETGTMFCFYEGRKESGDNAGDKALFYRTSVNGKDWSCRYTAAQGKEVHNISLLGGLKNEVHLFWCNGYNSCYYKRSIDGGITWGDTVCLSYIFKKVKTRYPWNYFAISNGHGLLLKSGRLLLTAWMSSGVGCHKPACLVSIYSDDNGESWSLGNILDSSEILPNPTECSIAQLRGGAVLATIRHNHEEHYRGFAISRDEGISWEDMHLETAIPDPICSAGLVDYSYRNKEYLVLSNCDYFNKSEVPLPDSRQNLTLWLSENGGNTWKREGVLAKLGGYSDLLYCDKQQALYCFYENEWQRNQCFSTKKLTISTFLVAQE
jgi:sialidase-1